MNAKHACLMLTALVACHRPDPSSPADHPLFSPSASATASVPFASLTATSATESDPEAAELAAPPVPAAAAVSSLPPLEWAAVTIDCTRPSPAKQAATPHSPRWARLRTGRTEELSTVWGSGPRDVWFVGAKGTMLHTMDGGLTFSHCTAPGAPDLTKIWGSGPNDIWILGPERLLHGTQGGTQWKALTASEPLVFVSIWGTSPSDLWFVVDGLARDWALRSEDSGSTWVGLPFRSSSSRGSGGALAGPVLWGSSPNDLWSAFDFFIQRSTDGGKTWASAGYSPGAEDSLLVRGHVGEDVWVLNSGTQVGFSLDYGKTWLYEEAQQTPPPEDLLWARSFTDLWSAGKGFAWVSGHGINARLGKAPWVTEVAPTITVHGIWGSSTKDVWAVGPSGLILHRH